MDFINTIMELEVGGWEDNEVRGRREDEISRLNLRLTEPKVSIFHLQTAGPRVMWSTSGRRTPSSWLAISRSREDSSWEPMAAKCAMWSPRQVNLQKPGNVTM